jgi:hypothetical protein
MSIMTILTATLATISKLKTGALALAVSQNVPSVKATANTL